MMSPRTLLFCLALSLETLAGRAVVVVNEIVASNGNGLRDENGDASDWVELHNPSAAAADLAGFGLSDDPARPFKWTFREASVPAGGYLVVFASGKDRQPGTASPVSPTALPGLRSWLAADAIDTRNASQVRALPGGGFAVRSWPSKPPGILAASQIDPARQPALILSSPALGGAPAVRFDGLDDLLAFAQSPAADSFTIFVVAAPTGAHEIDPEQNSGITGTSGQRYLFGAAHGGDLDAGLGLSLASNGASLYEHGSGHMPAVAVLQANFGSGPELVTVSVSNRNSALFWGGSMAREGKTSLRRRVMAPTEIGGGAYGFFSGDVAELIVFERALGAEERSGVEAWLAARHKIGLRAPLHTSFAISSQGEAITLTRPGGALEDQSPAIAAPRDSSLGRSPNGTGAWRIFPTPTPGAANVGPSFTDKVAAPSFSMSGGFYTSNLLVTLSCPDPAAVIRYTLDGSEPTPSSPVAAGPILVTNRSNLPNGISTIPTGGGWQQPANRVAKGTVLRARAFKEGALASDVATRSFFVLPPGKKYQLPVFSLSTDASNLFSADKGIYVAGNSPGGNYFQRGDDWERPVFVEYFETNGAPILAQAAGLRTHGNTSRQFPQKALRLHPLNQGGEGPFEHQFFPDLNINVFERLMLRPSGHDHYLTFFRDALMQELVRPLGMEVQAYRPAIVFINGEYWGIHNIREAVEENYFTRHFGVAEKDVDYLEGHTAVNAGDAIHYLDMIGYIAANTITQPGVVEEIGSRMEIGSFFAYKAAEIFYYRWDIGNIRYWRPRTPGGRWRWMMFDNDVGWGGFAAVQPAAQFNMLAYDLEPNGPWRQYPLNDHNNPTATFLLRALLAHPDLKAQFINQFADMLNTVFHPSRVIPVIDRMAAGIQPEMSEHMARWRTPGSMAAWQANVEYLRQYARDRPLYARQHLRSRFGLGVDVELTLGVGEAGGGRVEFNSMAVSNTAAAPFKGAYFKGLPIQLKAVPEPGHRFVGWLELGGFTKSNLTLSLPAATRLTALFEPIPPDPAECQVAFPHPLKQGPYIMDAWSRESAAGTFPASSLILFAEGRDPGLGGAFEKPWAFPYNLESRSRVEGVDGQGLAFINTSDPQTPEAGYAGAFVVGLDLRGVTQATLEWTAGTLQPNSRPHALRLQWRAGTAGPFADWLDETGVAVEYASSDQAGGARTFGPLPLPAALMGVPCGQIRWVYSRVSGGDGPRAKLRLDDIAIRVGAPAPPKLTAAPRPSGSGLVVRLGGGAGSRWVLERSGDLRSWTPAGEIAAGADREIAAEEGALFLRARKLP